ELKKQQAQRKYAEAAEIFNNSVYEQSDSLKPVADKLKLQVQSAPVVTRQPRQGAGGPLANPKFLAALFSPDAVEKKRNTEAMEIAPNQLVSGRIVQYSPARTRPLEEVKAQVREALIAQRATELARKEGQEKLAAWKAAPASASLPAAITLSREETQKQPRQIVEAALRAEAAAAPVFAGVDLGNEGYAVVKVNKTLPRPEVGAEQAKTELTQFGRWETAAQSLAYYELLKERFKVQIKAPKPQEGQ
ncbi:MAG TPA: peptidyl-prolyl cis-trans isomerase, partial [Ramlibacter sp.]|nr:peptidyl-prolyl cis-trans isomerase [Ramlibacter sp.]